VIELKSYCLYFAPWIILFFLTACIPLNQDTDSVENSKISQRELETVKVDNFTQDIDYTIEETGNVQIDGIKEENEQESETFERLSDDYIIVDNNGLNYSLTTYGTGWLEDGVVLLLTVYNQNKEIGWCKSWNGIDITELAVHSPAMIKEETLYLVVNQILYAFNSKTGEKYWELKGVGSSDKAPLLDDEGKIYLISQIEPYVSAVSKDGNVIWQCSDDSLLGAYDIRIENNKLEVKSMTGEYAIDTNGQLLSEIK